METIRLELGKQAPVDADCIRVEEQLDGSFRLTASALCIDDDEGSSVSIVGGPVFGSADEAEAAGLTWARDVGVTRLFISTATPAVPFETIEMDED